MLADRMRVVSCKKKEEKWIVSFGTGGVYTFDIDGNSEVLTSELTKNVAYEKEIVGGTFGTRTWRIYKNEEWTSGEFNYLDSPSRIRAGNGIFMAVAENSRIYRYIDGVWMYSRATTLDEKIWDAAYGDGKWVAVGRHLYTSTSNGASWTRVTSTERRGIVYGDGKWVAIRDLGRIDFSANGTSWQTVQSFGGTNINISNGNQLGYYNGVFVVNLTNNEIVYSYDGQTWELVELDIKVDSISNNGDMFFGVSNEGYVVSSKDMINFNYREAYFPSNVTDITFLGGE